MKQKILTYLTENHPWRDSIHCYKSVTSTNDLAKEMAKQGAPADTVLIAGHQTGGRGRLGRSFHSPADMGIYLSAILRPNCKANELMHLTCATAVAMCDAVDNAIGIRPGIKWTNDLVWNSRKIGGILTELGIDPATGIIDYAIVGIGLNCCQSPEDFPPEIQGFAGSLAMASAKPVCREAVCAEMIRSLESMNSKLLRPEHFMDSYRKSCITLGKEISILRAGEVRHGKALDIDKTGGLIVAFPDGHLETVSSGEVSIRGMYGYV